MERQTKEFYLQFETETRERRGDCVLIEGTKVAGEPRRRSLPYILIFPHILKLALLSSFQMNHTAPARVRSFPTRTGSLICCHQPVQPSPVCGGWVSTHTEHSRDVQARRKNCRPELHHVNDCTCPWYRIPSPPGHITQLKLISISQLSCQLTSSCLIH